MPRQPLPSLVTSWPFVASLLMLLANDAWLKAAWPGWLTGKLSDVAGVAVVAFLLLALGLGRAAAYTAVAALLGWWKSPWADGAIAWVNAHAGLPFTVGRVLDPTDLLALAVLPLCGMVAARPRAFALPRVAGGERRWLRAPLLGLTAFALVATSRPEEPQQIFQLRHADGTALDRQKLATGLAQAAAGRGLRCEDCAAPTKSARFASDELRLAYTFTAPGTVTVEATATPDGLFSGPSSKTKFMHLREAVRRHLVPLDDKLEIVEPLAQDE